MVVDLAPRFNYARARHQVALTPTARCSALPSSG